MGLFCIVRSARFSQDFEERVDWLIRWRRDRLATGEAEGIRQFGHQVEALLAFGLYFSEFVDGAGKAAMRVGAGAVDG